MWHWDATFFRRASPGYQRLLGAPLRAAIAQLEQGQAVSASAVVGATRGLSPRDVDAFWTFVSGFTEGETKSLEDVPLLLCRVRPPLSYGWPFQPCVQQQAAALGPDPRRIASQEQWDLLLHVHARLQLVFAERLF